MERGSSSKPHAKRALSKICAATFRANSGLNLAGLVEADDDGWRGLISFSSYFNRFAARRSPLASSFSCWRWHACPRSAPRPGYRPNGRGRTHFRDLSWQSCSRNHVLMDLLSSSVKGVTPSRGAGSSIFFELGALADTTFCSSKLGHMRIHDELSPRDHAGTTSHTSDWPGLHNIRTGSSAASRVGAMTK